MACADCNDHGKVRHVLAGWRSEVEGCTACQPCDEGCGARVPRVAPEQRVGDWTTCAACAAAREIEMDFDVTGDGLETARRIETRAGLLAAISKAEQEAASLTHDLATCPNLSERERAVMASQCEAWGELAEYMRGRLGSAS
jgi:hypothetical protein